MPDLENEHIRKRIRREFERRRKIATASNEEDVAFPPPSIPFVLFLSLVLSSDLRSKTKKWNGCNKQKDSILCCMLRLGSWLKAVLIF